MPKANAKRVMEATHVGSECVPLLPGRIAINTYHKQSRHVSSSSPVPNDYRKYLSEFVRPSLTKPRKSIAHKPAFDTHFRDGESLGT